MQLQEKQSFGWPQPSVEAWACIACRGIVKGPLMLEMGRHARRGGRHERNHDVHALSAYTLCE